MKRGRLMVDMIKEQNANSGGRTLRDRGKGTRDLLDDVLKHSSYTLKSRTRGGDVFLFSSEGGSEIPEQMKKGTKRKRIPGDAQTGGGKRSADVQSSEKQAHAPDSTDLEDISMSTDDSAQSFLSDEVLKPATAPAVLLGNLRKASGELSNLKEGQTDGLRRFSLSLAREQLCNVASGNGPLCVSLSRCLAEVIRVYGPKLPYSASVRVRVLSFMMLSFAELRSVECATDVLSLLQLMEGERFQTVLVALNDSDVNTRLFSSLLENVEGERSMRVEQSVERILSAILEQLAKEDAPPGVLEVLFQSVLPSSEGSAVKRRVAVAVLRRCAEMLGDVVGAVLVPLLEKGASRTVKRSRFFKKDDEVARNVFPLVVELHRINPALLVRVLPHFKERLNDPDVKRRLLAVQSLGKLFSDANSTLSYEVPDLFSSFLVHFRDQDPSIRCELLACARLMLVRQNVDDSSAEKELPSLVRERLLDPVWSVRQAAVEVVCAVTVMEASSPPRGAMGRAGGRTNSEDADTVVDHGNNISELLPLIGERIRDVNEAVRRTALLALAGVWRRVQERRGWGEGDDREGASLRAERSVEWIPTAILEQYHGGQTSEMKYMVDRATEMLLPGLCNARATALLRVVECLVSKPSSSPTGISSSRDGGLAGFALLAQEREELVLGFGELVRSISSLSSGNSKETSGAMRSSALSLLLSRLPSSSKNERVLETMCGIREKLFLRQLKEFSDPSSSLSMVIAAKKEIRARILETLVKDDEEDVDCVLLRCSPFLPVDLCHLLIDKESRNYGEVRALTGLLPIVARSHGECFAEWVEGRFGLLCERGDAVYALSVLEAIGTSVRVSEEVLVLVQDIVCGRGSVLPPSTLEAVSHLECASASACLAVRCLFNLAPEKLRAFLQTIFTELQAAADGGERETTRLCACLKSVEILFSLLPQVELLSETLASDEELALQKKCVQWIISTVLRRNRSPESVSPVSEDAKDFPTKTPEQMEKILAVKAVVASVRGLCLLPSSGVGPNSAHVSPEVATALRERTSSQIPAISTFLFKILRREGEISNDASTPQMTRDLLSLCAASQVLVLCTCPQFERSISPAQFQELTGLCQDVSFPVRSGFFVKLRKRIHLLPLRFLVLLVLLGNDSNTKLGRDARAVLASMVRRQRRTMATYLQQKNEPMPLTLQGSVSPEHVLPHLIYVLAHHPDFSLIADRKQSFINYFHVFFDAVLERSRSADVETPVAESASYIFQILSALRLTADKNDPDSQNIYFIVWIANRILHGIVAKTKMKLSPHPLTALYLPPKCFVQRKEPMQLSKEHMELLEMWFAVQSPQPRASASVRQTPSSVPEQRPLKNKTSKKARSPKRPTATPSSGPEFLSPTRRSSRAASRKATESIQQRREIDETEERLEMEEVEDVAVSWSGVHEDEEAQMTSAHLALEQDKLQMDAILGGSSAAEEDEVDEIDEVAAEPVTVHRRSFQRRG